MIGHEDDTTLSLTGGSLEENHEQSLSLLLSSLSYLTPSHDHCDHNHHHHRHHDRHHHHHCHHHGPTLSLAGGFLLDNCELSLFLRGFSKGRRSPLRCNSAPQIPEDNDNDDDDVVEKDRPYPPPQPPLREMGKVVIFIDVKHSI